jgi:hypothetical protein
VDSSLSQSIAGAVGFLAYLRLAHASQADLPCAECKYDEGFTYNRQDDCGFWILDFGLAEGARSRFAISPVSVIQNPKSKIGNQ